MDHHMGNNAGTNKRHREREQRKARAVRLYLNERLSHAEIAERMDLERSTVTKYINEAEEEWLEGIRRDMGRLKAQQLEELRQLDDDLRGAQREAGDPDIERKIIAERRRIRKDIADLLGLDEPLRIEGEQKQIFEVTFDKKAHVDRDD